MVLSVHSKSVKAMSEFLSKTYLFYSLYLHLFSLIRVGSLKYIFRSRLEIRKLAKIIINLWIWDLTVQQPIWYETEHSVAD